MDADTLTGQSDSGMDGLDRVLAEKRERAKARLIATAQDRTCPHCKQALPADDEGWMTAFDLKRRVYGDPEWESGDHGTIGCALYDLLDAGVFERGPDQRVRLRHA